MLSCQSLRAMHNGGVSWPAFHLPHFLRSDSMLTHFSEQKRIPCGTKFERSDLRRGEYCSFHKRDGVLEYGHA